MPHFQVCGGFTFSVLVIAGAAKSALSIRRRREISRSLSTLQSTIFNAQAHFFASVGASPPISSSRDGSSASVCRFHVWCSPSLRCDRRHPRDFFLCGNDSDDHFVVVCSSSAGESRRPYRVVGLLMAFANELWQIDNGMLIISFLVDVLSSDLG
jgi:hypothetical protein